MEYLPINVLKYISEYLNDEYIIFFDEDSGYLVKKLLKYNKDDSDKKKNLTKISDNIYNNCSRILYITVDNNHINNNHINDNNYKILTSSYKNYILKNNKWVIDNNNIFVINIKLPFYEYEFFGYNNENKLYIKNSIHHNYYNLIIENNNNFNVINRIHFPFTFKEYIGFIKEQDNYYNIHWCYNEEDNWHINIFNNIEYKTYDFLSNFDYKCNTFICDKKIIVIYKKEIIICEMEKDLHINIKLIKKVKINFNYNGVYFSNNNLYFNNFDDNNFINNIYCYNLKNNKMKLITQFLTDLQLLNIESSKSNFTEYIDSMIEYKEKKYKLFLQKCILQND
jgi:hypothetical protein